MPFEKGNTGRPKGSISKRTIIVNELIGRVFNKEGIEKYLTELKDLKGKVFIETMNNLIEYVLPKLQRSENVNENFNIDLDGLSKDELIGELRNIFTEIEQSNPSAITENSTNQELAGTENN